MRRNLRRGQFSNGGVSGRCGERVGCYALMSVNCNDAGVVHKLESDRAEDASIIRLFALIHLARVLPISPSRRQ